MKNKLYIVLSCFIFLTSLPSCFSCKKLYQGNKRRSQIVIVKREHNRSEVLFSFRRYDYTSLAEADSIPLYPPHDIHRCLLLPGTHTIKIFSYNGYETWDDQKKQYVLQTYNNCSFLVTFNTEAGKTYIISSTANHEEKEIEVCVTEEESGRRIESTVVEITQYRLKQSE